MLKTNSKQVSEKIKKWINDNFDASGYEREDLNNADISDKISFIAKISFKELGYEIKAHLCNGVRGMFDNWCRGLPSLIDTAFYYCHSSAVDLVGDILEQTAEQRAKYSESQPEDLMTYLFYREVEEDLFAEYWLSLNRR